MFLTGTAMLSGYGLSRGFSIAQSTWASTFLPSTSMSPCGSLAALLLSTDVSRQTWISFARYVIFGGEQTTYKPNRRNFPTSTYSSNSVKDGAALYAAKP